jgi:hypothetical protein
MANLHISELEVNDLEIGIFNATIDYANNSKVQLSWKCQMFLEIYSNSLIIVKGKSDIEAVENACRYHNITYKEPLDIFDIAYWNKKSHEKCGTAKLEGTYTCIVNEIPDETGKKRHLREILPLGEAHDPSSDAAMTFLVALYITSVNRM